MKFLVVALLLALVVGSMAGIAFQQGRISDIAPAVLSDHQSQNFECGIEAPISQV